MSETAGSPALRVARLTVRYGAITAVDAVSFEAQSGEILGLLGPNGAGKTSVIRAATTVVPVAGGTVTVAGHLTADAMAVRSRIGVLPESNGYPGGQTARSYLTYYGQLFGLDREEAADRGARLLDSMGLGDRDDRISNFSRGMRQRLGLARALINEPTVLFLDEPTLGLDPAGQADILAQLTRLALERSTCVVICSHLLDEIERVCDRVAIMDHGSIVAAGTVDDVIRLAGVGGRGRVRVPLDQVVRADGALRATDAVATTHFDNARPGDIDIEVSATPDATTTVLRALLDAGVEPETFDLRGARLSDAFLALTATTRNAA